MTKSPPIPGLRPTIASVSHHRRHDHVSSSRYTPPATDAATRSRMQATRSTNSRAEMALRSALHRRGLRFRLHRALLENKRYRADIVFPRHRVAIFVDGCFWHSCPLHGTRAKAHREWWDWKLERNRNRDEFTNKALVERGWTVVRVWEHDDPVRASEQIAELLAQPDRRAGVQRL